MKLYTDHTRGIMVVYRYKPVPGLFQHLVNTYLYIAVELNTASDKLTIVKLKRRLSKLATEIERLFKRYARTEHYKHVARVSVLRTCIAILGLKAPTARRLFLHIAEYIRQLGRLATTPPPIHVPQELAQIFTQSEATVKSGAAYV